jgi:hypothetical protein
MVDMVGVERTVADCRENGMKYILTVCALGMFAAFGAKAIAVCVNSKNAPTITFIIYDF